MVTASPPGRRTGERISRGHNDGRCRTIPTGRSSAWTARSSTPGCRVRGALPFLDAVRMLLESGRRLRDAARQLPDPNPPGHRPLHGLPAASGCRPKRGPVGRRCPPETPGPNRPARGGICPGGFLTTGLGPPVLPPPLADPKPLATSVRYWIPPPGPPAGSRTVRKSGRSPRDLRRCADRPQTARGIDPYLDFGPWLAPEASSLKGVVWRRN